MKIKSKLFLFLLLTLTPLFYTNCGGSSSSSGFVLNAKSYPLAPPLSLSGTESNVLPVSVGCGYVNEPCVSVTVCQPGATLGSSSCTTINNILLDTGSFGLRLFSDQIPGTVTLPPITDSATGNPLAECVSYVDTSSDWGPVVSADVYLGYGNEKAANVPTQIINASYAGLPSNCLNPDTYSLSSGNPNNVGFNGILGVGLFTADCGDGCASDDGNQMYFACSGSTCTGAAVPSSKQVSNPVSFLTSDNNGVILQLPNVASSGATSLTGYLVLGIGTQSDNSPPTGVTMFQADSTGNFQTYYSGQLFTDSNGQGSFIDSGSNAIYFPDANIPQCTSSPGFYCPVALDNLTGVAIGANNSPQDLLPFQVANGDTELSVSNPNVVFDNLAGPLAGMFDWGFPFFLGKSIYVGIDGATSSLGAGPYWGF